MKKSLAIALVLCGASTTTSAKSPAAMDPAIVRMLTTPASVMDVFLLRLYEAGKCNNVVRNENADEADLCLTTLDYDAERNLLNAFFRVLPAAPIMDDFVDLDADGRQEILLQLLDNTARRMGAVDTWGLLHSTPVAYGGKIDADAVKAFRAALAARTTVALVTSYNGVVYRATRHHDGKIDYFQSK